MSEYIASFLEDFIYRIFCLRIGLFSTQNAHDFEKISYIDFPDGSVEKTFSSVEKAYNGMIYKQADDSNQH